MPDVSRFVLSIQRTGSRELRNSLLYDLKDEALKIARMHCIKYGREPSDEEYQIALCAMDEAIDRYDARKNPSFRAFCKMVIERKLIDFSRKEKQEEIHGDEHDSDNLEILSYRKTTDQEFHEDLRDELRRFERIIENLGYKWSDIMANRPRHWDSLDNLQSIALHIINLDLGKQFLIENPLSRGLRKQLIGIESRTLKKYRPYLCAVIIAHLFDFPIIQYHLKSFRREVRNGATQRRRG